MPPSPTDRRPSLPNVAIGGRMRVGKTTCADHLVARYGYRRRALADPIKEVAREGFGWDGRKDARGRRLLQDLGTAGRAYDPAIWLGRFEDWLAANRGGMVVVDDVRLLAEVELFRRWGFLTILVLRPGMGGVSGPLGEHETETEIERARLDVTIVNDGTIEDLARAVDAALDPWIPPSEAGPG